MTRNGRRQHIEFLVDMLLNDRLVDAGEPPGLREAVVQSVLDQFDTIQDRIGEQLSQLRSPSSRRVPDAYLFDEENVEDALQHAAAGIRSALARAGRLSSQPRSFEFDLARALTPSARWAVFGEASRVPRPASRHPLLSRSLVPIPWLDNEELWPPPIAIELGDVRNFSERYAEPVRVHERPYTDWVQLGLYESQTTPAMEYPDLPKRQLLIMTGLEVAEDTVPSNSLPYGISPPDVWCAEPDRSMSITSMDAFRGPLVSRMDYADQPGTPDRHRGVGVQSFNLVPRTEIVALLGLRPEAPPVRYCLTDEQGPALVARNWRGFLVHDGNYAPLLPAVRGADLIIRPDLYKRLERSLSREQLRSGVSVRYFEEAEYSPENE